MLYFIYGLVILLNSFLGFGKKYSKTITFFTLLFIWVLFWGNTLNADLESYAGDYENIKNNFTLVNYSTEMGFIFLMKIGTSLGLDFIVFRAIITLICYMLIHSTVVKYTKNSSYVYFMYMLYPVFLDIVQFRNFIVMSLVIFGIRYLVKDTVLSKTKYLILILISSTIQNFALFFAPFILVKKAKKNKLIKTIACIAFISSLIIFFNGNKIPYIDDLVVEFIDDPRAVRYLTDIGQYGFLIAWISHIGTFLMLYWGRKIINSNKVSNQTSQTIVFVDLIFWINAFIFLYFPLFMMDTAFYRIIRSLIFPNMIAFSLISDSFVKGRIKKYIFNLSVTISVLAWLIYELLGPLLFTVFKPIMENNIFFGG